MFCCFPVEGSTLLGTLVSESYFRRRKDSALAQIWWQKLSFCFEKSWYPVCARRYLKTYGGNGEVFTEHRQEGEHALLLSLSRLFNKPSLSGFSDVCRTNSGRADGMQTSESHRADKSQQSLVFFDLETTGLGKSISPVLCCFGTYWRQNVMLIITRKFALFVMCFDSHELSSSSRRSRASCRQ